MRLPVFGIRRKRLEALAALATISLPADDALCTRCGCTAKAETSRRGIILGALLMPAFAQARNLLLCGKCALVLLELISPDKVGSQMWQDYKAQKLQEWG